LLNCAISYLDGGLTGDGIHETLSFKTPHSLFDGRISEWFMQLFTMSFLTICVQILLAIFSGIIIDSFGEVRDRAAEVSNHLQETDHLLSQSTYRQYVGFFVFLKCADVGDAELTDLEEYIFEEVGRGTSDWLPYRHGLEAQRLQQVEQGREADAESSSMRALREQLELLTRRFEEFGTRFERLERPPAAQAGARERTRFDPRGALDSEVALPLRGESCRSLTGGVGASSLMRRRSLGLSGLEGTPRRATPEPASVPLSGDRGTLNGTSPRSRERDQSDEDRLGLIEEHLRCIRQELSNVGERAAPERHRARAVPVPPAAVQLLPPALTGPLGTAMPRSTGARSTAPSQAREPWEHAFWTQ